MVKEIEDPFTFDRGGRGAGRNRPRTRTVVNVEEVQQLREFKAQAEAEKRESEIASTFDEVGFSPKAAKLFAALNPEGEVTTEAVRTFARTTTSRWPSAATPRPSSPSRAHAGEDLHPR